MWLINIFFISGQRPNLIEGCPEPIEQLMTQCWDKVPAERPSMAKVSIKTSNKNKPQTKYNISLFLGGGNYDSPLHILPRC